MCAFLDMIVNTDGWIVSDILSDEDEATHSFHGFRVGRKTHVHDKKMSSKRRVNTRDADVREEKTDNCVSGQRDRCF